MDRKKISLSYMAFVIFCYIILCEGYYWALISRLFVPMAIRYVLYFAWAIITAFATKRLQFPKQHRFLLYTILIYMFLILFRNREFSHGSYAETLRLVCCLGLLFISFSFSNWYKNFPKAIMWVGLPNVLATLLFYMNNGLYQTFISRTYGYYQTGTGFGVNGYKAALTDNYSQNGTNIAIVVLTIGTLALVGRNSQKVKIEKKLLVLFVISMLALLLTTKRAHILFSVATLIITYYLINYKNKSKRTFNLLILAAALLAVFAITLEYVPALTVFTDRFRGLSGEDVGLSSRLVLWERAIMEFLRHPLLGIGWYGFRYVDGLSGNALESASSGAHNCYIELLCDSGIVGFITFVLIAGMSIRSTVQNFKIAEKIEDKKCLSVSFAIQFFVLLYGFSGNALFDKTFNFYAIALAMNYSYLAQRQREGVSVLHSKQMAHAKQYQQ